MSYYQLPSGAYRARLMINGVRHTEEPVAVAAPPTLDQRSPHRGHVIASSVTRAPSDRVASPTVVFRLLYPRRRRRLVRASQGPSGCRRSPVRLRPGIRCAGTAAFGG